MNHLGLTKGLLHVGFITQDLLHILFSFLFQFSISALQFKKHGMSSNRTLPILGPKRKKKVILSSSVVCCLHLWSAFLIRMLSELALKNDFFHKQLKGLKKCARRNQLDLRSSKQVLDSSWVSRFMRYVRRGGVSQLNPCLEQRLIMLLDLFLSTKC